MFRRQNTHPIGRLLIAIVLIVPGCTASPSSQKTSSLTQTPASGDVSVWSWNIAAKALMHGAPGFEKNNPGVRVDVQMTGARMETRMMLALASGVGAPDVASLQQTETPYFISTGKFTDLTQVAQEYKASFPQAAWNNCTLDGKIYAIPWDLGPCAVYYKRDLFQKYNIDPSKIVTWDDYIQVGKEILQKSGGRTKMLPLGTNDLESMFELLIQQTGGQVFDSEGRVAINSQQCRQALEIIRRMREAGICSDVPAYSQEWMAGFNSDTIATYPGAFWLSGTIEDSSSDFNTKKGNWAAFRLPAVATGGIHVSNLGGSVLVIPAQCPNKAAAWAFVRYVLCSREGQLTMYKSENLFPALLPALKSPAMDSPDPFFGGQHIGSFFATDVEKIPALNRTKNWSEAQGYLQQDLSHWASTGMNDPEFFDRLAVKMEHRLDEPASPKVIAASGAQVK